ncbi:uncharacterized protein TRAVEDRAFT_31330 [Trametes versicolor FP-101664 SS1]|uniref:uncharacterized protein n=1 Tax=Trametes versicolor (strain FP-101664) TaxID=717944 RepID=UPI00046215DF|nr:uncharacterized protein TRAVEDRAFT_31330 [Trametes versicolor FP-101664 SS1]EIW54358.1 hypothetical protein TRAVEDRAFT_31330 [Trametes versicolor FP-101664 SS1]
MRPLSMSKAVWKRIFPAVPRYSTTPGAWCMMLSTRTLPLEGRRLDCSAFYAVVGAAVSIRPSSLRSSS